MEKDPVSLDLARFPQADIDKILALQERLKLLRRWFRCERKTEAGVDRFNVFSGDHGPVPYAGYRISRHADGHYELADYRTDETLATGRTVDAMITALPDRFFSTF